MQTFKNGDPIKAFSISSSIQICWQIAINLVLHEGNREKQTILTIICTNTSTWAMRRLLLWNLLFFQCSSIASPYMVIFMGSSNIGKPYRVQHNYYYGLIKLSSIDSNEVVDWFWKRKRVFLNPRVSFSSIQQLCNTMFMIKQYIKSKHQQIQVLILIYPYLFH